MVNQVTAFGKADYAANTGEAGAYGGGWRCNAPGTPTLYDQADNVWNEIPNPGSFNGHCWIWGGLPGNVWLTTGVICVHSRFKLRDITDGASNTYLAGEKFVSPDCYDVNVSGDWGNDECWDKGFDYDNERETGAIESADPTQNKTPAYCYPPLQDQAGYGGFVPASSFGSAHANSLNMVFCDGSVQAISYSIDPMVHRYLGNRHDGKNIDAKAGTYGAMQ